MARRSKRPQQFEISTDDGRTGFATVEKGVVTVTATSGATGTTATQVGGLDAHELAKHLLSELPARKRPPSA
jgi:hypothetical protein